MISHGVEISIARKIEDAEHGLLSGLFFFYIIVFIVLTVQEFACSQSDGVNKTTKANRKQNKTKNNNLILQRFLN